MANWKKIITSGSNAEFNQITGSTLQLTNAPHSGDTTPLVIDANGNVSTGSAYALASGGNTVGGSSLSSSVAIVGAGGSLIQTASSIQNVDFNSANLKNITNLTASNVLFDTVSISGNTAFKTSSTATELEIPTTNLTSFKIGTSVTMSNVPEVATPPFYLAVSSSGEIVKVDKNNVGGSSGGSGSGGSIVREGTNIDITGVATDVQLYDLGGVSTNGSGVTQSILLPGSKLGGAITDSTISAGDKIELVNYVGSRQEFTIASLESSVGGTSLTKGITTTTTIPAAFSVSAQLYHKITTPGVATINLDNNISLTTITASQAISSSGEIIANTITASGLQVTGDLDADGNIALDGTLSFNGLNFTQANVGIITGSNTFGSGSIPSDITHTFTGSVLITGSKLELTEGTLSIPGFSDVSASLATLGVAANLVTLSSFNTYTGSIDSQLLTINTNISNNASTITSNSSSAAANIATNVTNIASNASTITSNSASAAANIATNVTNIASNSSTITSNSASLAASITSNASSISSINTSITNAITHDGSDNVTIAGNLTVLGDTTTISTQDLVVEDRFIVIGSGSNDSYDVGLIFDSGSTDTSNRAFYYDASEQRFTTAKNINHLTDPETINTAGSDYTGDIVTVKHGQSGVPDGDSVQFGKGEFYITSTGDIYVYTD